MIAVRPITQHGLSGLPTSSEGRRGSAISGKRQIKDKRYWLVYSLKIYKKINFNDFNS